MKKTEIKVTKNTNLRNLLKEYMPYISNVDFFELLKKKDIKLNGKKIGNNLEVKLGDIVTIFTQEEKIDVIYEDKNVLIVDKPIKMEVVSTKNGVNTLTSILEEKYEFVKPIHRLDTNTKGLVVFALNEESYTILLKAFKDRLLDKYYLAQVKYSTKIKSKNSFTDFLFKQEKSSLVKIYPQKENGTKEARLEYELLSKSEDIATIKVRLITGLTHQIRAQLAFHDMPILGDAKYGDIDFNSKYKKKYQSLIAYNIVFRLNGTKLDYLNKLHIMTNFTKF